MGALISDAVKFGGGKGGGGSRSDEIMPGLSNEARTGGAGGGGRDG